MIRPISISLAVGLTFLAAASCRADETFPVVHNEPITVRIVSGKNGNPLSNLHLVLLGGYDQSDLHDQLYREEVLTDSNGKVRLSNQLANLPWLQVWVGKMPLCQSKPRKASFSVELIRRDGLNAPNLCGPVLARESPGIFTVFVKNRAKKLKNGVSVSLDEPFTPAPAAAHAPASVPAAILASVSAPATKTAPNVTLDAKAPTALPPALPASALLPIALAQKPAEAAIQGAIAPLSRASAALILPTKVAAILPHTDAEHPYARRVGTRRSAHRTRPVPVSCSALPPVGKTPMEQPERSRRTPAHKIPVSAAHHSKPLAGIRLEEKTSDKPKTSEKQE